MRTEFFNNDISLIDFEKHRETDKPITYINQLINQSITNYWVHTFLCGIFFLLFFIMFLLFRLLSCNLRHCYEVIQTLTH